MSDRPRDRHRDRTELNDSISFDALNATETTYSAQSVVNPITIQEACQLSQKERLNLLMRFNGMAEPTVIGVLEFNQNTVGYPYWVRFLNTLSGKPVHIPLIEEFRDPSIPLKKIPPTFNAGDFVSLGINVIHENAGKMFKEKPFLLGPDQNSVLIKLESIPEWAIVRHENKILLKESLLKVEKKALIESLKLERQRIESEILSSKLSLENDIQRMTKEADEKKSFFISINEAIAKVEDDRINIELQVTQVTQELATLKTKKEMDMAAYQQMCEFARQRADSLLALDLISDDQYKVICGTQQGKALNADTLSWQDDLGMNYSRAVSTIQAYLLSKGIIYPRWLIGNFLTLLRTNDLIILSGLSGAGKTQIVRSFAEAMGGVAHIIPVKPNWTGAEDLLGFFNPLQRSYVRTPFLEALLDASSDPDHLHLICLDEMNLARAEYYFADFLSALEDRSTLAEISLYSENEASHIQSEVRMLLAALNGSDLLKSSNNKKPPALEEMLNNSEVMAQLRAMFGETAAESFPAFHGRVRRALSTVLDIPSKLLVPNNVRFIGAINVDQTTYGLSPKILDRAHVLRFENPLKYSVDEIRSDVKRHEVDVPRVAPVYIKPVDFSPQRTNYPDYDSAHPAAQWLLELYHAFLEPLGIDVAYRTIRQAQLYWNMLADISEGDAAMHDSLSKNLIVLQKILPKFTMDGKILVRVGDTPEKARYDIVGEMESDLEKIAKASALKPNMHDELQRIRLAAKINDKIFNYWA